MKNTVNLKNIYTEQLTRLQQKHQHECELLEDLRLFAKQRSIIEKEYAQSLSKLAQQYLSKRTPIAPPSLASQEGNKEQKTMHEVWQTLLEETEKVGKTRLMAADVYSQQISDSCKLVRGVKVQVAKKVFENLVDIQKDLTSSIQELTKLQKIYRDDEHVTHDARFKAADAEDKVKKKSVGLFTSMSKLQQQSAKLNSRRETCEAKSTASRNEYLLSLAAVNAHLNRYYTKDAPELIKAMDGEIYEKMQEYFTAFCQAELQSCGITQECFMRILADSTKVNRDFQLRGFLQDNPIFTDLIQYQFQAQDNDPTNQVSTDHQNLSQMESETKKCAVKFVQEDRAFRQGAKKLQRLLNQVSPSNKGQDQPQESSTSIADPQVKCEEMKHLIRKAGIEKTKLEARLESLRTAGINVDVYVSVARSESKTPEDEEELPALVTSSSSNDTTPQSQINSTGDGGSSMANINVNQRTEVVTPLVKSEEKLIHQKEVNDSKAMTDASNEWDDDHYQQQYEQQQQQQQQQEQQEQMQQHETQSTVGQALVEEEIHEQVEDIPEVGRPCVAIYTFQASASNELDINEGERLEALGEVGDGWIRARNMSGGVGLVPVSYIHMGYDLPAPDLNVSESVSSTLQQQQQQPQATAVSFEYNGDFQQATRNDGPDESVGPTENGHQASYSTSDYEVQAALTTAPLLPTMECSWARAMYDYYATCDEELSFPEGQLIKILKKELHDGVDDGWWEGEFNGRVGVFPSLVVEELNDEKPLESPQRPGPPQFSPPPPDSAFAPDTQPSPPPPFEPNPQLEITMPTPDGGKATSELLQAHSLAYKVAQEMRV